MKRIAAAAAIAATAGCFHTVTTTVTVDDALRARLESTDGRTLVAAGPARGGEPAVVAEGNEDSVTNRAQTYRVTAERAADGAIAIAWQTSVPLPGGTRDLALAPGKPIEFPRAAGEVIPESERGRPELRVPLCTELRFHGGSRTTASSYVLEPQHCDHDYSSAIGTHRYDLVVPWDAATVVEHTSHEHAAAAAGLFGATLVFGTFGGLFLSFPDSSVKGGATGRWSFIAGCAAAMLAVDVPMLVNLLREDRDVVIRRRNSAQ